MAEKLLEIRHLSVRFGRRRKPFTAVDDVSFDIYRGETFGLVGESGSGKTTIGRAIIRVCQASEGEILYRGERISGKIPKSLDRALTRKIQMIFQDPMASLNERAKVSYIVSEGIYRSDGKRERAEKVSQALRDVGLLPEFAGRFPHEFSGGQRQRIGIARALVMQPEFIIADEPISALDVSIRAQVLNLLSDLQKEHALTYLFISHDLSVMRFICDRIAWSWRTRRRCLRIRCTRIPARCSPPCRCRIPSAKKTSTCWCTTHRATTIRRISPRSWRSSRGTSSTPTRRNKTNTGRCFREVRRSRKPLLGGNRCGRAA